MLCHQDHSTSAHQTRHAQSLNPCRQRHKIKRLLTKCFFYRSYLLHSVHAPMSGITEIIHLVTVEYLQPFRATNQLWKAGRPYPSCTDFFKLQGKHRIRHWFNPGTWDVNHSCTGPITGLILTPIVKASTLPSHVLINCRTKAFRNGLRLSPETITISVSWIW